VASARRVFSDAISLRDIGREWAPRLASSWSAGRQALAGLPFIELDFDVFVRDPIGELFGPLGWPITVDIRTRAGSVMTEQRSSLSSTYELADFCVTQRMLDDFD